MDFTVTHHSKQAPSRIPAEMHEPVIRSTELHPPNLFWLCEELADDLVFSIHGAEDEDSDHASPWVTIWADVAVRGVDQGEVWFWRRDQNLRNNELYSLQ